MSTLHRRKLLINHRCVRGPRAIPGLCGQFRVQLQVKSAAAAAVLPGPSEPRAEERRKKAGCCMHALHTVSWHGFNCNWGLIFDVYVWLSHADQWVTLPKFETGSRKGSGRNFCPRKLLLM